MLPKGLNEIKRLRDTILARAEAGLSKDLRLYQNDIATDLIKRLYSEMDVMDGIIQPTARNYRVMARIESGLEDVASVNADRISGRVVRTAGRIGDFNTEYMRVLLGKDFVSRIDRVKATTDAKMLSRIGVSGNRLTRGGFLSSFTDPTDVLASINDVVMKSITGGEGISTLTEGITQLVQGDGKEGFMERKLRAYAHDIFQQYDASYSKTMADEFSLNYFIYQGGLVEESRDMCREFNGMIFHKNEVNFWKEWKPAKAVRVTDLNQKDIYSIPSYIDFAGYSPLIDRGGYNCRHSLAWISDEMANKMKDRWYSEIYK